MRRKPSIGTVRLQPPLGHRDARNELATLLNGPRKDINRPQLDRPRLGETQLQTVQIDFQHIDCSSPGRASSEETIHRALVI